MDPEQLGQLPLQMTAPPRVASQEYIKPPKTSIFTESVPSASSFCVVKILSEISNKYEVERQLKFELMHETINSKLQHAIHLNGLNQEKLSCHLLTCLPPSLHVNACRMPRIHTDRQSQEFFGVVRKIHWKVLRKGWRRRHVEHRKKHWRIRYLYLVINRIHLSSVIVWTTARIFCMTPRFCKNEAFFLEVEETSKITPKITKITPGSPASWRWSVCNCWSFEAHDITLDIPKAHDSGKLR